MKIDWDTLASETSIEGYTAPETASYLNQDPKKLLDDPRFIEDVRRYFLDEGKHFGYDDDAEKRMVEEWWQQRNFAMTNITFGTLGDLNRSTNKSHAERERMKRLEQAYEAMPMPWQEGGAGDRFGGWSTTGHIAYGMLADPLNLIPISKAGQAARLGYFANQTGKGVVRSAALKAGAQEAAAAGAIEFGADALIQQRDMDLGLQDEYSLGQGGLSALGGSIIGGTLGTAIGTMAAKYGVRYAEQDLNMLVKGYGLDESDLTKLTPEWLRKFQGDGGRLNHTAVMDYIKQNHPEDWQDRTFRRYVPEDMRPDYWRSYIDTLNQEVKELSRLDFEGQASPEIRAQLNNRMLDVQLAEANMDFYGGEYKTLQEELNAATATGDPAAIQAARDKLAEARAKHQDRLDALRDNSRAEPEVQAEQAAPETAEGEAPDGEGDGTEASAEDPEPTPERQYWNSLLDSDNDVFAAAGINVPAKLSKRFWISTAKKAGVEWDDTLSVGQMTDRVINSLKQATDEKAMQNKAFEEAYRDVMLDFLTNVQEGAIHAPHDELVNIFKTHLEARSVDGFDDEVSRANLVKRFNEGLTKASKANRDQELRMGSVSDYMKRMAPVMVEGEGPDLDIEGAATAFDDPTVAEDVKRLVNAIDSATRAGDDMAKRASIKQLYELVPEEAPRILGRTVGYDMTPEAYTLLQNDPNITGMSQWADEILAGDELNGFEKEALGREAGRLLGSIGADLRDSGKATFRGISYTGKFARETLEMIVMPSLVDDFYRAKKAAMGHYPRETWARIVAQVQDMPQPEYERMLRAYERSEYLTENPVSAGEANTLATVNYDKLPDGVQPSKETALNTLAGKADGEVWFVNDQPGTRIGMKGDKPVHAPIGSLVLMRKNRGATVFMLDADGKNTQPKYAPGYQRRSQTAKRGHPLPKLDGKAATLPGNAEMTVADMPVGRTLAIRRKDNPLMVRPAMPNSANDFTAEKLLSFVDDPENWEVGHVDVRGAWSNTDPHKDPGRWLTAVDSFSNDFEPGNWSERPNYTNVPTRNLSDVIETEVDLREAFPDLTELQSIWDLTPFARSKTPVSQMIDKGTVTYQELSSIIVGLERPKWNNKSIGQVLERNIAALEKLYPLQQRLAQTTPLAEVAKDREAAVAALKGVYKGLSQAELTVLTDTLDRLAFSSDAGVYPSIASGRGRNSVDTLTPGGKGQGRVNLTDVQQKDALPRVNVALHEFGHWSWSHILTANEKLQFVRALQQRVKEKGTDGLWDLPIADPKDVKRGLIHSNAPDNINELFADQFMLYVGRNKPDMLDMKWWQKVGVKMKVIIDRFVKGSEIDPELVPIFERILPTDEVIKARLVNEGGVKIIDPHDAASLRSLTGKASKHKGRVVHENYNSIIDGARLSQLAELRDRLNAGDVMDIEDISTLLGSLVPEHGSAHKVFRPLMTTDKELAQGGASVQAKLIANRPVHSIIRDHVKALKKIGEYRRGTMSDDEVGLFTEVYGRTPDAYFETVMMNPEVADSLPASVDKAMELIAWDMFERQKILVDGYTPLRFDAQTTWKTRVNNGRFREGNLRKVGKKVTTSQIDAAIMQHQEARAMRYLRQYDTDVEAMKAGTFDPALYRAEGYTPEEKAAVDIAKATGIESPDAKAAKRRVNQAKKAKGKAAKEVASQQRQQKQKQKRQEQQADATAEEVAGAKGNKAKAPTPVSEVVAAGNTELTSLTLPKLRQKVAELGTTKGGEGYARELVRRVRVNQARAKGIAANRLAIPDDVARMLERPLREELATALAKGDTERATIIENEFRRRAMIRKEGEAAIGRGFVGDEIPAHLRPQVKTTSVKRAVSAEKAKNKGASADGTSPNADVATRMAQEGLTHRNTEIAYDIRQMFSRLMSLAGTHRDKNAPQALIERLAGDRGLGPVAKGDMTPVDVTSDGYKKLRNTLRRLAGALHGTGGKTTADEAMGELAKLVIRAVTTGGQYTDTTRGARAATHPWIRAAKGEAPKGANLTDWLAEQWQMYAKGQHKGDGMLSLFHELDESMALLTRGVIRADAIASTYGNVTRLGDVFDNPNTRDLLNFGGGNHPILAAQSGENYLQRMEKKDLADMAAWVGGPIRMLHTDGKMRSSDGLVGNALYLSDDPYAVPLDDVESQLRKLDDGKRSVAVDALESLNAIEEKVAQAVRKLTFVEDPAVAANLWTMIDNSQEQITDLNFKLKALGVDAPSAANVVTSAHETADLSSMIWYGGRSGLINRVGKQVEAMELASAKEFKAAFTNALPANAKTMNGADFHNFALDFLEQFADTEGSPDRLFRDILETIGYDSARLEDAIAVFDPAKVRSITDDFSTVKVGGVVGTADAMSQMTARMADGPLSQIEMARALEVMEANGEDKTFGNILWKLGKNRSYDSLTESEKVTYQRFTPFNWLAENSVRIRNMGMRWFGDWIKPLDGTGFYERFDHEFAGAVMPIMEALEKVEGFDHWWQRAGYSINPFRSNHQPQSMSRIVKALRYGAADSLRSDQERAIFEQVRQAFDVEWEKLKEAGIVGERPIEDYFPQLWDADKLRANKEVFVARLARYFVHENDEATGEVMDVQVALERARYVYNRIVDNDAEYYLGDTYSGGIGATESEHIGMQRVLRLHEFPQFLKGTTDQPGLEDFMEDNLQAVLAKYFQGTTRQRMFQEKFGINNHAINDYFTVIGEGKKGAARLLSSGKVKRVPAPNMIGDANSYVSEKRIWAPIARSPAHATDLVNTTLNIMRESGNVEDGIAYLKTHLPEPLTADAARGNREQTKRLEAVANALWEFKGEARQLPKEAKEHAEGTFMLLSGRHPYKGTPHFDGKWAISRWIRAANSLTLLSYTMLTSFSDTVLPLVRSGDFNAWRKGVTKWASDRHYKKALRNIGVSIENIAHQRMTQLYGVDATRGANAFFNFVGLTPWTNAMREMAASVGLESFKAELARAQTATPGSNTHKNAVRYLRHFGLASLIENGRAMSDEDLLSNTLVREAMLKFTNESVFSPNANDLPVWSRGPFMALVTQLKSFPLMMGRMAHRAVIEDPLNGKFGPALALAGALPAAGITSLAIKDYAQMRGGEDNREFDLAVRNEGTLPWIDGDDLSDRQKKQQSWLAWYMSGFMQAGGFGLIADMLISATEQVDNGAYGTQRISGLILGPWYDLGFVMPTNAVAGMNEAMFGDGESNAKQRSGVRSVVGRIPLVGGNKAAREGITDLVAGEQQERGGQRDDRFDADFSADFNPSFDPDF